MIAYNDLAVGQLAGLVSHSRIWKDSLILVLEDDSQDGADHVDAHRILRRRRRRAGQRRAL
ncbi:MAG: hypothetical protein ACR2NB_00270 [Solirubrobacteraceae bacterium]